jgi:hypothetical protein
MPASIRDSCAADPRVAIDRAGRQYYAFLAYPCGDKPEDRHRAWVVLAVRDGSRDAWKSTVVSGREQRARDDDLPAMALGQSRLFLVWTRWSGRSPHLIARVRIGNRWTGPSRDVTLTRTEPLVPSIAARPGGGAYVSWWDGRRGLIQVAQLDAQGRRLTRPIAFPVRTDLPHPVCDPGPIWIAAQPRRCVNPSPGIAVSLSNTRESGRVYLTYAERTKRGERIAFRTLTRNLKPIRDSTHVRPAYVSRDQFMPAIGIDGRTGTVWVCFYETVDRFLRRAQFTCVATRNMGVTWSRAVRAASRPSDETQHGAAVAFGFGDYQGVAALGGVAHPMWTDSRLLRDYQEEVFASRISERDVRWR